MKRIVSLMLLVFILISMAACQARGIDPVETTEAATKADYHPADPDSIAVSEEELAMGYRIYQGIFYYEGGGRYLYEPTTERIYVLPQLIGSLMPADFYNGFTTGDTVRIKAVEKTYAGVAELQGKQISLVYEGDLSSIPEEALKKIQQKDSVYFED